MSPKLFFCFDNNQIYGTFKYSVLFLGKEKIKGAIR